jgi:hypothetical protein|tara:strand:+ start:3498 stop:3983 length:486 start_codon:yes stop_codon:yes gene_type:complete
LTKNKDYENVIPFPSNRIVEKSTTGPVKDDKFAKKLKDEQTKQFIETSVDDISINLLRSFYNLAIKTNRESFTKDLAMVVDMMRGLVYRDFGLKHPAQSLSDKLVELKTLKDGSQNAKIDYTSIMNTKVKTGKPFSPDIKDELRDINDSAGMFEGDPLDDK